MCRGIKRVVTEYPVWDVSYDVAIWCLPGRGSAVWVINAVFVWLPLLRQESDFKNEITVGSGVTACIGATIFVWASVLLMLEAVKRIEPAVSARP
jgi:hypothetical protein